MIVMHKHLTWNAGTTTLGVSNGNNVDLISLEQTLTILVTLLQLVVMMIQLT